MSLQNLTLLMSTVEALLGMTLLALLIRTRELKTYWPMLVVSMWQVVPFGTLMYLRHLGKSRISPMLAYDIYFPTYWVTFVLGALSAVAVTYTILHGAMRPLKGLQQLAKIVYFWAASVSLFVAIDNTRTLGADETGTLQNVALHFQRASGIITISLILFVCFAIRPMGLSARSRIFGTAIGLGMLSVTTTIDASFLTHPKDLFSKVALVQTCVNCLAEGIWVWYFSRPEPKRKFVLLATTSPFHAWNRIAEQFGAAPGFVAIGGIAPDAFASAEMEVFHRATARGDREREEGPDDVPPALPGR